MLRVMRAPVYYPGGASHSTLYPEASPSCPGDRRTHALCTANCSYATKIFQFAFLFIYFLTNLAFVSLIQSLIKMFDVCEVL